MLVDSCAPASDSDRAFQYEQPVARCCLPWRTAEKVLSSKKFNHLFACFPCAPCLNNDCKPAPVGWRCDDATDEKSELQKPGTGTKQAAKAISPKLGVNIHVNMQQIRERPLSKAVKTL